MRMTPPARERRPPVGTARRRRANRAMLLSPMAQTVPAISLQIGRVPGSTIRATGTAPFAALSGSDADQRSAPPRLRATIPAGGLPRCSVRRWDLRHRRGVRADPIMDVCRGNAVAPGRRQPGWGAGQGTPASSPGGGFTPAPPRAAGREGVTPTAKKRGDGLERRPPVGTRWPPASARRIGKWRCGSPLGTYPTGRSGQRSAFPCLQVAPPGGLGTETCTIPELHFHDRRGVRADPIMDVSLAGGLRAPATLSTDC